MEKEREGKKREEKSYLSDNYYRLRKIETVSYVYRPRSSSTR